MLLYFIKIQLYFIKKLYIIGFIKLNWMSDDYNFEEYLRKALSNSISSQNPSENAKSRARKLSPSFYEDLNWILG